jgi:hypothetical protein
VTAKQRKPGANGGAIRANDFTRKANGCGQAGGDHASSRTDPDDVERQTGIYGSGGLLSCGRRTGFFSRCPSGWLRLVPYICALTGCGG